MWDSGSLGQLPSLEHHDFCKQQARVGKDSPSWDEDHAVVDEVAQSCKHMTTHVSQPLTSLSDCASQNLSTKPSCR